MERWLTYDQISLIPTQVSTIEHRADVDTSVQFGPIMLDVPIIAAPMPDVSNGIMAQHLAGLRSLGWTHRFQTDQEKWQQAYRFSYPHGEIVDITTGIAVGLRWSEEAVTELYNAGARIFCIDTANGASTMIEKAVKILKDKYPDIFIVTGNVASAETFYKLQEWGADAIRVGIAGGSVCETRTETGVYSPMASVIMEINGIREDPFDLEPGAIQYLPTWNPRTYWGKRTALLIADGGIKTPADMCKALALGADVVMMGGALAGTKESPGEIIKLDGKLYKKLRGAASFGVQKETNEKDPDYIEGSETLVPYVGSVEKVINRFAAGLRSSMSYMNARNLTEYRNNVKIVELT